MSTNDNMRKSYNGGSGRYTSNGFIPSRRQSNNKKGCMSSLLIILLPIMGVVLYAVSQAVS